jgi:hypothetical protein
MVIGFFGFFTLAAEVFIKGQQIFRQKMAIKRQREDRM